MVTREQREITNYSVGRQAENKRCVVSDQGFQTYLTLNRFLLKEFTQQSPPPPDPTLAFLSTEFLNAIILCVFKHEMRGV